MTDWRGIAKARGLNLPPKDLDRIVQPLEALDEAFRPLVKDLSPDLDPAFSYGLDEE